MRKVTKEEMKKLEEITVNDYGVSEDVLMEEAGSHVAELIRREFSSDIKIAIICGKGNNGGDGFVAARELLSWGYNVEIYTPFEDDEISDLSLKKLETVRKIDEDAEMFDFPTANAYVDALIGYGLEGPPRGKVKECVEKIEEWSADTISIDIPTGVDADTGEPYEPHIDPEYTVTLGLPKKGLREENSGKIYLVDIGIPIGASKKVGIDTENLFLEKSVLEFEEYN